MNCVAGACVCGWCLRFFHSRNKAIVQTKQQEMKFAKMSLCHLRRFFPDCKGAAGSPKVMSDDDDEKSGCSQEHDAEHNAANVAFIIKQCLFLKRARFSIHSSLVVCSEREVSRLRTC